eukprot:363484-Chlamydomonas_euryale.AAC.4
MAGWLGIWLAGLLVRTLGGKEGGREEGMRKEARRERGREKIGREGGRREGGGYEEGGWEGEREGEDWKGRREEGMRRRLGWRKGWKAWIKGRREGNPARPVHQPFQQRGNSAVLLRLRLTRDAVAAPPPGHLAATYIAHATSKTIFSSRHTTGLQHRLQQPAHYRPATPLSAAGTLPACNTAFSSRHITGLQHRFQQPAHHWPATPLSTAGTPPACNTAAGSDHTQVAAATRPR